MMSTSAAMPLERLMTLAVALPTAGAGVVHLGVAGQHLEHPLLVAGFIAMGTTQLGLAGLTVMRQSRNLVALSLLANLSILALWVATRLSGLPFVEGLHAPQVVGIADVVATVFEVAAVSAAALVLILPRAASAAIVTAGQRYAAVLGAAVLLLTVPGLIAPHSHGGVHGAVHDQVAPHVDQGDHPAEPSHETHRAIADTHGHAALTHEQATAVLMSHGHAGGGHPPSPAQAHPHAPSTPGESHDHLDEPATPSRADRRVLSLGEGHLSYEPRTEDGTHGRAFRWHEGRPAGHHGAGHACGPSREQQATADAIVRGMKRTLSQYDNNPWRALRDGFVAYPIPLSKMFHMVALGRYYDGHLVDPARVESFMYAMTDRGLTAVGGMFIFPHKDRKPPNPTGCLLIWHQHTGGEGLVTSFDPQNPDQSVAMAHVWTFGGLEPWGRDFDGSEPHMWFFAYRGLPAFCAEDGDCI